MLACLVLMGLPVFAEQLQQDGGVWRTAAPAPMKRTEVAAATVGGKIYVVGGFEQPSLGNVLNFAITPAVDEYDPAVDRWSTKASMPVGLHHVGIGVVGGHLYIIGGYKQSGLSVWGPLRQSMPTILRPMPGASARRCRPLAARCPLPCTMGSCMRSAATKAGRIARRSKPTIPCGTVGAPALHCRPRAIIWRRRRRPEKCTPSAEDSKGDYHRNLSVTEVYDPLSDKWSKAPGSAHRPQRYHRCGSRRPRVRVRRRGRGRNIPRKRSLRSSARRLAGHGADAHRASRPWIGGDRWARPCDQRRADSGRQLQQSE